MKSLIKTLFFFFSIGLLFFNANYAQDSEIELIMDCSGSMMEPLEGKTRIEVAKESATKFIRGLPKGIKLGLRAYGHRYGGSTPADKAKSCMDTELLFPIGSVETEVLCKKIEALKCYGWTPIAYSLEEAGKDFTNKPDINHTIILLSDGLETCGGDPVAVAKALYEKSGLKVVTNVVGFAVSDQTKAQLEAIASVCGGKYYGASDQITLTQSLEKAVEPIAKESPKDESFFLDEFDGETLNSKWEHLFPDENRFLIENGQIIVISRPKGEDKKTKTVFSYNTLRFSQELPKNFEITLDAEIQESKALQLNLEVSQDDKNLMTTYFALDTNYPNQSYFFFNKVLGGETNSIRCESGGVGQEVGFKNFPAYNPFQLKIQKLDRNWIAVIKNGDKEFRLEHNVLKMKPKSIEITFHFSQHGNYPEREIHLKRFEIKKFSE